MVEGAIVTTNRKRWLRRCVRCFMFTANADRCGWCPYCQQHLADGQHEYNHLPKPAPPPVSETVPRRSWNQFLMGTGY